MAKVKLRGMVTARNPTMDGRISGKGGLSGEVVRTPTRLVKDYNVLDNKPKIEGIELIGDRSLSEIGVEPVTNIDIELIFQS